MWRAFNLISVSLNSMFPLSIQICEIFLAESLIFLLNHNIFMSLPHINLHTLYHLSYGIYLYSSFLTTNSVIDPPPIYTLECTFSLPSSFSQFSPLIYVLCLCHILLDFLFICVEVIYYQFTSPMVR